MLRGAHDNLGAEITASLSSNEGTLTFTRKEWDSASNPENSRDLELMFISSPTLISLTQASESHSFQLGIFVVRTDNSTFFGRLSDTIIINSFLIAIWLLQHLVSMSHIKIYLLRPVTLIVLCQDFCKTDFEMKIWMGEVFGTAQPISTFFRSKGKGKELGNQ